MKRAVFVVIVVIAFVLTLAVGASAQVQVLSQAELSTLVGSAEQFGTVTSAEDVRTTAATALELNPYFVPQDSAVTQRVANIPVSVVVMHGHFVDTLAKMRPGGTPPEGDTIAYTVDSATGEASVSYVGERTMALSGLGSVERFTASAGGAVISRNTHRLPHAKRHRQAKAIFATWGSGCKEANGDHCYDLAEWLMKGSEEVEGTQTYQKTTTMDVPESEAGDFVDMEEWVIFDGGKKYPEVGQQGGPKKAAARSGGSGL